MQTSEKVISTFFICFLVYNITCIFELEIFHDIYCANIYVLCNQCGLTCYILDSRYICSRQSIFTSAFNKSIYFQCMNYKDSSRPLRPN